MFMADRVLTRLQKRTHVFENKKANEKRNVRARICIRQLDAGVSLSRAVKLGPGERRRRGIATFVLRLEWFIRKFILTRQVMMGYFKADLPR